MSLILHDDNFDFFRNYNCVFIVDFITAILKILVKCLVAFFLTVTGSVIAFFVSAHHIVKMLL